MTFRFRAAHCRRPVDRSGRGRALPASRGSSLRLPGSSRSPGSRPGPTCSPTWTPARCSLPQPAPPPASGEHAEGPDGADAHAGAGPGRRLHRVVGGRERRRQQGRASSRRDLHRAPACCRACSSCPATTRPTPWPTRPAGSRDRRRHERHRPRASARCDTTAVNPSGLDAPQQFTSAYDLALIARAAMKRPDFRAYATTVKAKFPGKMNILLAEYALCPG